MYCKTEYFTIAKFFQRKNAINKSPEYQRQGNIWGIGTKELFLDSLFKEYDVPKIYMHKLPSNGGTHEHALIDGKQRLQCIWDFLDNEICLGNDFVYTPIDNLRKNRRPYPKSGDYFKDLEPFWQDEFKSINLATVIVYDTEDTDSDIEDLFLRLNSGEPLSAAEKRNAIKGKMSGLVQEIADKHKFFTSVIAHTSNKRHQHRDLAARFLLIENFIRQGKGPFCTLKKPFLDSLVKEHANLDKVEIEKLRKMVTRQLNTLVRIFQSKDILLKKAGSPQLYYLFVKEMLSSYGGKKLLTEIKEFLSDFKAERLDALNKPPEEKTEDEWGRYAYLDKFERLTMQANDKMSLEERVSIMKKFFLIKYPNTKILADRRYFSDEERFAIFIRAEWKCAECDKVLHDFKDFHADHIEQWVHGGETTLNNACALCQNCNVKKNEKVA